MVKVKPAKKNIGQRIIIHFDYDAFYASVLENENPALKLVPLAVQQKQIVVTCNYEARRRGLRKLQLIWEAKRLVPDVVVVLGEDLTRFRDASKANYNFLRNFIWNTKIEKLGFDEVFLDVTDIITYNVGLLNPHDLAHSFFHLDKNEPAKGFPYDAATIAGETFPAKCDGEIQDLHGHQDLMADPLYTRLLVGSHLAKYLRHQLEEQQGYTATAGISTSKLLSKLVGNVCKPRNQTTLLPPYETEDSSESTVTRFLDSHEIGRIPGIGFKSAAKVRCHVLGKEAGSEGDHINGATQENVTVKDVRLFPGMGPELLEEILGGPGSQKSIGGKVWDLINGIDEAEVNKAKSVPSQISIEDSYKQLDTFEEIKKELLMLSASLIRRMRIDLLEEDADDDDDDEVGGTEPEHIFKSRRKRWLAHPRTLRLSTRPQLPLNLDGSRPRPFNRISRSGPMPNLIFNLTESDNTVAKKLVDDTLLGMFRKLHPEKSGWNLSLVNIAAMNMVDTASDSKDSSGRDIGKMFRQQETSLREWKIEDKDMPPSQPDVENLPDTVSETVYSESEANLVGQAAGVSANGYDDEEEWVNGEEDDVSTFTCPVCGSLLPQFALKAHETFHALEDC